MKAWSKFLFVTSVLFLASGFTVKEINNYPSELKFIEEKIEITSDLKQVKAVVSVVHNYKGECNSLGMNVDSNRVDLEGWNHTKLTYLINISYINTTDACDETNEYTETLVSQPIILDVVKGRVTVMYPENATITYEAVK